jgi:hypothetical protein
VPAGQVVGDPDPLGGDRGPPDSEAVAGGLLVNQGGEEARLRDLAGGAAGESRALAGPVVEQGGVAARAGRQDPPGSWESRCWRFESATSRMEGDSALLLRSVL